MPRRSKKGIQIVNALLLALLPACGPCNPEYSIDWYKTTNQVKRSSANAKIANDQCQAVIPDIEENPLTVTVKNSAGSPICAAQIGHIYSDDHDDHTFVVYSSLEKDENGIIVTETKHTLAVLRNAKKNNIGNISPTLEVTLHSANNYYNSRRLNSNRDEFKVLTPLVKWVENQPDLYAGCVDLDDPTFSLGRNTGLFLYSKAKGLSGEISVLETSSGRLFDWIGDAANSIQKVNANELTDGYQSVENFWITPPATEDDDNIRPALMVSFAKVQPCDPQNKNSNSDSNTNNDSASDYCDGAIFCDPFNGASLSDKWTDYNQNTLVNSGSAFLDNGLIYTEDFPLETDSYSFETSLIPHNDGIAIKLRGDTGTMSVFFYSSRGTIEMPDCPGSPRTFFELDQSDMNDILIESDEGLVEVFVNGSSLEELTTRCYVGGTPDIAIRGSGAVDYIGFWD